MSFAHQYIRSAVAIVQGYDGSLPLHHHLKQFFAAGKKYGSRDRKMISHACYCYFRCGRAFVDENLSEQIRLSIFVCTDTPGNWAAAYEEPWLKNWHSSAAERLRFVQQQIAFSEEAIFPLQDFISAEIDRHRFIRSHVSQPDLFLRIRPGRKENVLRILKQAGIGFEAKAANCVAVQNTTQIDQLLAIDKDVVIQDISSQSIASMFPLFGSQQQVKVWDCCAASGGKSILASDHYQNIDLTVSDVRSSILHNLQKRFEVAGIKSYQSFVQDLTTPAVRKGAYDLVICDAPCSGSGTWGRTPEQLSFFTAGKISHYHSLQQQITTNAITAVKKGGYFLYITCSVFQQENEDVVEYIQSREMKLQQMQYFKGYMEKADTLFAALFTAS